MLCRENAPGDPFVTTAFALFVRFAPGRDESWGLWPRKAGRRRIIGTRSLPIGYWCGVSRAANRPRTTVAAAALAVALGVALAAAGAAAAAPPPTFFGVVSQSRLVSGDSERMAANGVGIMRFQLSWKAVQEREGECESDVPVPPATPFLATCDWREYDRIVGDAAAAGIESLPFLLSVPDFVSAHENEPPIRTARQRQAWAEWLGIAVQRYGPTGSFWRDEYAEAHPGAAPLPIRRWQVWNEPSDGTFWHPRPNADEYARLVELTARAIRNVDPGAEIVLAGLFATPHEGRGGIDLRPYLRNLFAGRDLGAHFDSLALHPYGPTLRRSKRQVRMARKEYKRAGLLDRPLWITELGWASGGDHEQLSKTPAQQAKLLKRAYRVYGRRRAEWNVAGLTWFAWQDTSDRNACAFCANAGLVTLDRGAKPALGAYRSMALRGRG